MRILIVDTYYDAFLTDFHAQRRKPGFASYADGWRALMDECFGTADYYSSNLRTLGHEAAEIVANDYSLQSHWAREHGMAVGSGYQWKLGRQYKVIPRLRSVPDKSLFYPILKAQVKEFRPDVLYIQDMVDIDPTFLRVIKAEVPSIKLVVGQIACAISMDADVSCYDLILSSLPHYVQRYREGGTHSEYFRIGFESSILAKLAAPQHRFDLVHIGGYSAVHRERNELLEYLLRQGAPLECWGYGVQSLPDNSPIRDHYRGEAWGLDMYRIRHDSRIVVSRHVASVASHYANIMTLYEATGVGSLLLIDQRSDLNTLFEAGREVAVYNSPEECGELCDYYLSHEAERAAIAAAGQARTLREHTYFHRMQELVEILPRYMK